MIVGVLTLFTLLFGGGALELFFLNDMDKGVKEYVIEKDRQKEILKDLKVSKKMIETFNKQRKAEFKAFKKLNASRLTTKEEFTVLFDELQKETTAMQAEIIDGRIALLNKIEQPEWDSIVSYSRASVDKQLAKAQKKADKKDVKDPKQPFSKTLKTITENIAESEKQKIVSAGLDNMISAFEELAGSIASINPNENELIVRKDASKDELIQLTSKMNGQRKVVFEKLIEFHILTKENTNNAGWDKIMKAFNKELNMTNH